MVSFTIKEILEATDGKIVQGQESLDQLITGISIDSRRIKPGELFLAIIGERLDGHSFLNQVVVSGAGAVVVMKDLSLPLGIPTIKVTNTLAALGAIANQYRRRFAIPVIGITGSNGKTTTKDLVASVLAQQLSITKTEGNFNNEIGMPLTLLNIQEQTKAAVVEMGMRGLGQIKSLAEIAEPNFGIVTNIGFTHLELLGSQANIAKAKAELVEALPESGCAILNGDDKLVREMQQFNRSRTILYGIDSPGLDYRAIDIKILENGSSFKVSDPGGQFEIQIPMPGRHNILNALAAVAVGRELNISIENIRKGLSEPSLTGKRLNIINQNGYRIVDDTYNASPTSVKAALDVINSIGNGQRKIAVLADMLELGISAANIHHEIGEYAASIGIDYLLTFGELAGEYTKGFNSISRNKGQHFENKPQLVAYLKSMLQTNDLILVKGSRGMKMEEIVAALSEMEVEA